VDLVRHVRAVLPVGVAFVFGGVGQLVVAGRVETWRWLFIVTGIVAVAAGIMTFVWPDITLYVVSILVAWYLWWTQLLPSGGGTAVLEVVGMGHQGACVLSD
jgi:hypothetical protein